MTANRQTELLLDDWTSASIPGLKPKSLKRAPIRMPTTAAVLGDILEVETGIAVFRWSIGEALMCWDAAAKALFWTPGKPRKVSKTRRGTEQAAKLYEDWHQDRPVQTLELEIPTRGRWEKLGRATRVDYWSDKDGHPVEYTHAIDGIAHFFRYGRGRSWMYVVTGLEATERGLVG